MISLAALELNIIQLQRSYQNAIEQLDNAGEEGVPMIAELNASITALGQLWHLITKDMPIKKLVEDTAN